MFVQGLKALVEQMRDDGGRLCPEKPEETVDAGYTYFGQFLDHELTRDKTKLDKAWELEPHDIENYQTPRLDLSHLYGGGFGSRDETLFDGPWFKVGKKVDSIIAPGQSRSFDVGYESGRLLVGDDRARENVILRQVTAVFARLHNFAVSQGNSFDRARQQTTWQFQRLVVEDFLRMVLDPTVYRSVFVKREPMVDWRHFSIPVEFSVAAFRFGHSLVRNSYFLRHHNKQEVLALMKRGLDNDPLEREWEIDWGAFFQGASTTGIGASTVRPIDTRIAPGLFQVPLPTLRLFNAGVSARFIEDDTIRLPLVNLMRGSGLGLASGQYAASRFGEAVLTEDELTNDCRGKITPQGEVLKAYRMTRDTPLFYYILKESEVRNNGNELGPTGSHIVAETIYAALMHDPTSYLKDPAGAEPPIWEFPAGPKTITSLISLFKRAVEF
jgi:Animal haem peroxidase